MMSGRDGSDETSEAPGERVEAVLGALRAAASARIRDEMGPRYGLHVARAMGVPMAAMQRIAKPLAPDHDLAAALWATGWYEARIVACLIDDPHAVTIEQMDRWRADFDNWGIVDTACFKLFDAVPNADAMIEPWSRLNDEFGRRAAFALLACMALHGHGSSKTFTHGLRLIEAAATDERNFVRKGVNWALRAIGGRKDPMLRAAARSWRRGWRHRPTRPRAGTARMRCAPLPRRTCGADDNLAQLHGSCRSMRIIASIGLR